MCGGRPAKAGVVPAVQPPSCVASSLQAASLSQVVGDVLLSCEQVVLRAACWGRCVRWELQDVLPAAEGPGGSSINHFIDALGTESVSFGF